MRVASWVIENSSLVGGASLVAGVLVASWAAVLSLRVHPSVRRNRTATFSTVAGVLLVAIAAVLAALGGGPGLWLTGLGGFLCLTVAAVIVLRTIPLLPGRDREPSAALVEQLTNRQSSLNRLSERLIEAAGKIDRLFLHATRLTAQLERVRVKSDQLVDSVLRTNQVDLGKIAQPFVERGLWAPLSVYTSHDDGLPLKSAIVDVLAAFGLTVVAEEPVERSSWFQRFWARLHSDSVRERMRKVEQAVELQYLGKVRADIDQAKAQAVAVLLQAISAQDNAVVRIGSLIAIKAQGDLAVWTVSELEAADMEQHSALLRDPISALAYLRKLKHEPSGVPYQPPDDLL